MVARISRWIAAASLIHSLSLVVVTSAAVGSAAFDKDAASTVRPAPKKPRCYFKISAGLTPVWQELIATLKNRSRVVVESQNNDSAIAECLEYGDSCATIWQRPYGINATSSILLQGCYDQPATDVCKLNQGCLGHIIRAPNVTSPSYFCCCRGHEPICNAERYLTIVPGPATDLLPPANTSRPPFTKYGFLDAVWPLLCLLTLSFTVAAIYYIHRRLRLIDAERLAAKDQRTTTLVIATESCYGDHFTASEPLIPLVNNAPYSPYNSTDLSTLSLAELLGRGRYGTVYRAVDSKTKHVVAVKVFNAESVNYFHNEVDILTLPVIRNGSENLLKIIGAAERRTCAQFVEGQEQLYNVGSVEHWLITELADNRTLQEFLKSAPVSWATFLNLAVGITNGLTFLHTEICDNETSERKPVIAHRDISSRNVLIKGDGTPVLADFGFSMALSREEVHQEIRLAEVGTIRYMAPEVLEGAVNLHDPTAALMQADVYSCGLVLWEIFWRCTDVWRVGGMSVPDYQCPYQNDVASPPSLEQMQLCVCKKQVRPQFAAICYTISPATPLALRTVYNYVEDCWERDPEGRATIACTHERFRLLQQQTASSGLGIQGVCDTTATTTTTTSADNQQSTLTDFVSDDANTNTNTGGSRVGGSSAATFVRPPAAVPLQPFQGRNPCQERNLLQDLSSDSGGSAGQNKSSRPNAAGGGPGSASKSARVSTRSSFKKVDPNDVDSLAAHLSASFVTTDQKNKPKNRLLDFLNLEGRQTSSTTHNNSNPLPGRDDDRYTVIKRDSETV